MRTASRIGSLFAVLAALIPVLAADHPDLLGKVVGISDGDTLTLLVDQTQYKVRLDGIDAPESHQAFGTKSKQALGDKVFGKPVRVTNKGPDRYGRTLGVVWVGDRNINLEMVKDGLAWHYKQFSKDKSLADAELEARRAKRGLWADANPTPPWEYRKPDGKSSETAEKPNVVVPPVSSPRQQQTRPASLPDTQDLTVYVTKSGSKYHRAGCKSLSKSQISMSLDTAKRTYEPCSICNPPR